MAGKTLVDLDNLLDRAESIVIEIKLRPRQSCNVDVTRQWNRLNAIVDDLQEIAGGKDAACVNAKRKRKLKKWLEDAAKVIDDDTDGDPDGGGEGETPAPPPDVPNPGEETA